MPVKRGKIRVYEVDKTRMSLLSPAAAAVMSGLGLFNLKSILAVAMPVATHRLQILYWTQKKRALLFLTRFLY